VKVKEIKKIKNSDGWVEITSESNLITTKFRKPEIFIFESIVMPGNSVKGKNLGTNSYIFRDENSTKKLWARAELNDAGENVENQIYISYTAASENIELTPERYEAIDKSVALVQSGLSKQDIAQALIKAKSNVKTVVLTQAEYDAIETPLVDTLYFIKE
jgi:hypothetical protein